MAHAVKGVYWENLLISRLYPSEGYSRYSSPIHGEHTYLVSHAGGLETVGVGYECDTYTSPGREGYSRSAYPDNQRPRFAMCKSGELKAEVDPGIA